MTFPFKVHQVPGSEALAKLTELETAGEGFLVILGDAEKFERVAETFEMNDAQSTEALIDLARGIDAARWFEERHASDPEYYEIEEAEWPDTDSDPGTVEDLTSHRDLLTGALLSNVHIAMIPAAEAWMVPCYLRIGGWNECPNAEEHAAIFKYWGEKYGARVVCIGDDVIEMIVTRPPTTREDALALAKEQYLYCADIVQQGTESIEVLAAGLLNSRVWYFWWD
jgi:hypothetical protein